MRLQKYKIIICLERMSSLEYYDFSAKNLKESLITQDAPPAMNMTTTDLSAKNIKKTRDDMKKDAKYDYSTKVKNPYGYGYVASLHEVRNQDAQEIQNQESTLFSLGAVAGVSLIVFGLLISSQQVNK
jgi:hypothetical protein